MAEQTPPPAAANKNDAPHEAEDGEGSPSETAEQKEDIAPEMPEVEITEPKDAEEAWRTILQSTSVEQTAACIRELRAAFDREPSQNFTSLWQLWTRALFESWKYGPYVCLISSNLQGHSKSASEHDCSMDELLSWVFQDHSRDLNRVVGRVGYEGTCESTGRTRLAPASS